MFSELLIKTIVIKSSRHKNSLSCLLALVLIFISSIMFSSQRASAVGNYLATDVLGQLDFNSSVGGTTSTNFEDEVAAVSVDYVNHQMYTADNFNNRVLIFSLDSNNNLIDKTADFVLGQLDFTSSVCDTTQSSMCNPTGVSIDNVNKRLFVADGYGGNSRVLVFDLSSGITNGMNASYVLGQADFTSSICDTTQSGMCSTGGVGYDSLAERLYVADYGNSRVLVFDLSSGIANGMNASYVLGQADFTSSLSDTTQSGMGAPWGVEINADVDDHLLFVTDYGNSRVLVFDLSSGITNGMNASYVLGQADFTSVDTVRSQSITGYTQGTAYDPITKRLFVDDNNNRILIFDLTTITNGEDAVGLLGQSSYSTNDSGVGQASFNSAGDYATTLSFDKINNRLWYPDDHNGRILAFEFIRTVDIPDINIGESINSFVGVGGQGTQSYSVTAGSLPSGITLNPTSGVLTGVASKPGVYIFTISVIDDNGIEGVFSSTRDYSLAVLGASTSRAPELASTGISPLASIIIGLGIVLFVTKLRSWRRQRKYSLIS